MKEFFTTHIQHLIYYRNKKKFLKIYVEQEVGKARLTNTESNAIDILKDFYISWYLDDKLYRCEGK